LTTGFDANQCRQTKDLWHSEYPCIIIDLMSEVTQLLNAIGRGDPQASAELLPIVYDELRKLAAQRLAQEKPGQTLQATALVHEAYLRLLGTNGADPPWNSRGHFFGAAAEAMRRILVESARRKQRVRHGGELHRVDFDEQLQVGDSTNVDLLALDELLKQLAAEEPEVDEVVKLRYFAGLTIEETAQALQLSVRTVNRHWAYARAWLYERMS
jgi:RNA polymerase sigma factor (TIGR02999 family)